MEFSIADGELQSVTVYSDRSELTRLFSVKVPASGLHNVVFKKLSQSVVEESIRIAGVGNATICDVIVEQLSVARDANVPNEAVGELRNRLAQLKEKHEKARNTLASTQLHYDTVKRFAENFSSGKSSTETLQSRMESLKAYLAYSSTELAAVSESLRSQEKDVAKISAEIEATEQNLQRIDNPLPTAFRQVSVWLETAEQVELSMHVSYQVWSSGWTPKYDVRVRANDNSVDIGYYGQIWQNTGEDWNDTQLYLSTAVPSIGGDIPELESRHVGLVASWRPSNKSADRYRAFEQSKMSFRSAALDECDSPIIKEEYAPVGYAVTNVEETVLTASFHIQRRTSIPSDGQKHKVTVGLFQLPATFEYRCVPKKAEYAYLTAKMTNSSDYPMLAGPSSIYLDGNFVANANIKAVSTNEEFMCSLGVDSAVRVTYKPLKRFEQQRGLLSKTKSCSFAQTTEVVNTRKVALQIVVVDQLPLSSTDKVKVTLVSPVVAAADAKVSPAADQASSATLNDKNNIEFRDQLSAGAKKLFEVKYVIDYPAKEDLQYW